MRSIVGRGKLPQEAFIRFLKIFLDPLPYHTRKEFLIQNRATLLKSWRFLKKPIQAKVPIINMIPIIICFMYWSVQRKPPI